MEYFAAIAMEAHRLKAEQEKAAARPGPIKRAPRTKFLIVSFVLPNRGRQKRIRPFAE